MRFTIFYFLFFAFFTSLSTLARPLTHSFCFPFSVGCLFSHSLCCASSFGLFTPYLFPTRFRLVIFFGTNFHVGKATLELRFVERFCHPPILFGVVFHAYSSSSLGFLPRLTHFTSFARGCSSSSRFISSIFRHANRRVRFF